MPIPLRLRLITYNDSGIRNAPQILSKNLRGSLEGLGKQLRRSAQTRMRADTGQSEKSLAIEVKGSGLSLKLEVYSVLIQAFADAFGIPRGKLFPPFKVGSRLHRWAARKAAGKPSKDVSIVKGERGLSHRSRGRKVTKVKSRVAKKRTKALTASDRQKARNSDADRIAFLAARSVFENGIRPTHWNTKTMDANKRRIVTDLANGFRRAVSQINRG